MSGGTSPAFVSANLSTLEALMADVNIQQSPPPAPEPVSRGGGGSAAGWAVAVLILVAVVGWFIFGGGLHRTTTYRADVKVSTPSAGSAGGDVKPPPPNPP